MDTPALRASVDADPPLPFIDQEIGSAAHEQHTPSVRALAVDRQRGLVLLNLVGADASVSAVIMELLRSKSNGIGFLPSLFTGHPTNIPTQLRVQEGGRYTIFRSALATPGGSLCQKNWCVLLSSANIAESRRRAPAIPPNYCHLRRPPRPQHLLHQPLSHPTPLHPRTTSSARRPRSLLTRTLCLATCARSAS